MRSVITRRAARSNQYLVTSRKAFFGQLTPKQLFSGYILHAKQLPRYIKASRYPFTTSSILQKDMSSDEVVNAEIAASTDPAINPNAPTFFDKLVDGSIPADIIYQVRNLLPPSMLSVQRSLPCVPIGYVS